MEFNDNELKPNSKTYCLLTLKAAHTEFVETIKIFIIYTILFQILVLNIFYSYFIMVQQFIRFIIFTVKITLFRKFS